MIDKIICIFHFLFAIVLFWYAGVFSFDEEWIYASVCAIAGTLNLSLGKDLW